jgi:hypothetical protein
MWPKNRTTGKTPHGQMDPDCRMSESDAALCGRTPRVDGQEREHTLEGAEKFTMQNSMPLHEQDAGSPPETRRINPIPSLVTAIWPSKDAERIHPDQDKYWQERSSMEA